VPLPALFEGVVATAAVASRQAQVTKLRAARGQPHPSNLWDSTPIPAVGAAAKAAWRRAPMPKPILPSAGELKQENKFISYGSRRGCGPRFGPHTTSKICRLGDPTSKHVVALLGDSHAGMWLAAMEADARAQGFAVVPLDKPGCILTAIHRNTQQWPCATWYQWALKQDRKLHPAATIVSFQLSTELQAEPQTAAGMLQRVLSQVRHGVLLTDPPGQTQQPSACIYRPTATMGQCSSRVPDTYVPLMHVIARMAAQTHHPAIPTLQWFCAKGVCPMVVGHTLTTRDTSHFTMQYSEALAPVLGPELKLILSESRMASVRVEGKGAAEILGGSRFAVPERGISTMASG
jgi:hypothetical protein